MLKLANINLDVNLIEEYKIYNKLLHLKWANDYISLIEELASKKLSHLLRSKI